MDSFRKYPWIASDISPKTTPRLLFEKVLVQTSVFRNFSIIFFSKSHKDSFRSFSSVYYINSFRNFPSDLLFTNFTRRQFSMDLPRLFFPKIRPGNLLGICLLFCRNFFRFVFQIFFEGCFFLFLCKLLRNFLSMDSFINSDGYSSFASPTRKFFKTFFSDSIENPRRNVVSNFFLDSWNSLIKTLVPAGTLTDTEIKISY